MCLILLIHCLDLTFRGLLLEIPTQLYASSVSSTTNNEHSFLSIVVAQDPRSSATVSIYFLRQKVTFYSYFLWHKVTWSSHFLRPETVAKFVASCLRIPIQCSLNCKHDTLTSDKQIMMS